MNKVDDWLRAYGYDCAKPTPRRAISPRAPKSRRPPWLITMVRKLCR